jgi:predicted tellurium resistance membrane protein TerC
MKKHFDNGTILVIILTGLLFIVALFVKGFTHELLLEAGVLLVSIKLIMMAYKNSLNYEELKKELHEIETLLKQK